MNGFGNYAGADLDGLQQQFGQQQQQQQPQNAFLQPQQTQLYANDCNPRAASNGLTYNSTHTAFLPSGNTAANQTTSNTFHAAPSSTAAHLTHAHLQQHQQQQHRHHHHRAAVARKAQAPPKFPTAASVVSSHERNDAMFNKFMASHRAAVARSKTSSGGEPFHAYSSAAAEAARKGNADQWLETISIKVSGISLDPLTGAEVLSRVRQQTDNVVTRYLPCVDFLVACQQELRTGLAAATQKRLIRHSYRDCMTPKEFFRRYIEPLHQKFLSRNQTLMEKVVLRDAVKEIQRLQDDARRVEYQGAEVMKNTFLGGMKDGESWGLRKWLSRHGGALTICNDIECILGACQKLDRSLETTRKLAERMRPLAKQSLSRLKNDVPSSYQEVSTAHPYLPFFHRLESALRGMANFDPEDDDVICIDDDDEIEEEKKKAAAAAVKRAPPSTTSLPPAKRAKHAVEDDDDDSVVEILDITSFAPKTEGKPSAKGTLVEDGDWICSRCPMVNPSDTTRCCMCGASKSGEQDTSSGRAASGFGDFETLEDAIGGSLWSSRANSPLETPAITTTNDMVDRLEVLATAFDQGTYTAFRPAFHPEGFWDHANQYASALRLFVGILCAPECSRNFVHPTDMPGLRPYRSVVKHPLGFADIFAALVPSTADPSPSYGSGDLSAAPSLSNWNMWKGMDLLQAMDLVIVNHLAYIGKEKSRDRSQTNKLRKILWDGIHNVLNLHCGTNNTENRRNWTPTRRGETSGFVIRK